MESNHNRKINLISKGSLIILIGLLLCLLIGAVAGESNSGNWKFKIGPDQYVYWNYTGSNYDDYYYTLSILTGWDILAIDYLEKVCPEDLATMPREMYIRLLPPERGGITLSPMKMFDTGSGMAIMNGNEQWVFSRTQHISDQPSR